MHSCLYAGQVAHRRHAPLAHQFQYGLYMAYLDLSELPELLGDDALIPRRWGARWSFQREDHLQGWVGPLEECVRRLVEERSGARPRGPIRLLTQLRVLGYYFSPLNLYYCFDPAGCEIEAVAAEVSNTPWNERHCYVLPAKQGLPAGRPLTCTHHKEFHVSPFMDMGLEYHWRLTKPGERLEANIETTRGGQPLFDAALSLERLPLNHANLSRLAARFPGMTLRITTAIYWQALKLWWKQCPFYSHPSRLDPNRRAATPNP